MTAVVPDVVPILSPGRHRNPRHGACLMEYTSLLAGERFSDEPACTERVLTALAQAVNDATSDAERHRLAPLASQLADANGGGPAAAVAVVRRCVLTALPYAEGRRRWLLLVAVFGADRAGSGWSKGFDAEMMDLDTDLALVTAQLDDGCADEAASFVAALPMPVNEYLRRGAPKAVTTAVSIIAESAETAEQGDEVEEVLRRLLTDCLSDYVDVRERTQPATSKPVQLSG